MIAAAILLAALAPQGPRVATVQVPEGVVVTDAALLDVDLDGATDLVLACRGPGDRGRSVQVHARQRGAQAFVSTPTTRFPLDRSVIAFTFCDCSPEPGRELVLLTATTGAAVVSKADGAPDFRQLFRHALVWPAVRNDFAVALTDAVADLDGDGRDDLVLPGPDRWTAWFQREGGAFAAQTVELPAWRDRVGDTLGGRGADARDGSLRLRVGNGLPIQATGALVRTSARTPPRALLDLDGDGRDDVVTRRNGLVFVGAQRQTGALERIERALPLPEDRLQLVDPSFDVQWPDVDGDGRRDLLLTTSAKRGDEVEARVDLFRADEDGGWPQRRSARLRMQPLGLPPQLVDADGDGRDDLVCVTIRVASMRDFTGSEKRTLDAQLTVFGCDGARFQKPPKLNVALQLATGDRRSRQPFLLVRPGRKGFPGDVLLRVDGAVERRLLGRQGDRLRLAAADARVPAAAGTAVQSADRIGDELLLRSGDEVRHVRFRR
ncbi:MAG: FG-GAP repeat domain-containing protein [Planctomycetota bacterium]